MSIEKVVAKQYRDKVNQAVSRFGGSRMPSSPREGWVRTVRVALGMTGAQLAKRAGVTKARISKAEQDELQGSPTLKTMKTMAEAMDCEFVYAIVPKQKVEEVIKQRAKEIAHVRVKAASTQMALEAQSLSKKQLEAEIDRITGEISVKLPADFWDDK